VKNGGFSVRQIFFCQHALVCFAAKMSATWSERAWAAIYFLLDEKIRQDKASIEAKPLKSLHENAKREYDSVRIQNKRTRR
jgi:hypothetical protein